ncbi:MAG: hypothetical protein CSA97_04875 [Bacteroidetes bacterium]|nr:MAG: hypothetical protein CSA97_04875 [Bacteroidota bacterium]
MKVYLEYGERFWELALEGARHTVRSGRVGSPGETEVRDFPTAKEARRDADAQILRKREAGYLTPGKGDEKSISELAEETLRGTDCDWTVWEGRERCVLRVMVNDSRLMEIFLPHEGYAPYMVEVLPTLERVRGMLEGLGAPIKLGAKKLSFEWGAVVGEEADEQRIQLVAAVREALEGKDYRWALELGGGAEASLYLQFEEKSVLTLPIRYGTEAASREGIARSISLVEKTIEDSTLAFGVQSAWSNDYCGVTWRKG